MKPVEKYFETHSPEYLTEDAEFTDMHTMEVTKGRDAIGKMLHYMYHEAFDAQAIVENTIVTDDKALLEATFKGRHIGEFLGIPATKKKVEVPLIVSYDLEGSLVKKARIYLLKSVLIKQLIDEG
ncbi:ester cyclase [Mangrovimonas aestuarii]|uniref:ester cyclase n=1 Tax=Mangrovimonas aestuarii TaxID=3018443 RepID=UPI002379063A|nr:ester cyclase [Mangrovimonas aestuarii]